MFSFGEEKIFVKFILKRDTGSLMKVDKPCENIILCLCMIVMVKQMTFQRKGTFLSKMFRTNPETKQLYSLLKQKIKY